MLDYEPYLITCISIPVKRGRLSNKHKYNDIANKHVDSVVGTCHDDKQRIQNSSSNNPEMRPERQNSNVHQT